MATISEILRWVFRFSYNSGGNVLYRPDRARVPSWSVEFWPGSPRTAGSSRRSLLCARVIQAVQMIRASERTEGAACRFGSVAMIVCAAALMMSSCAWGAEAGEKPDLTPQPWVTISLGTLGVPAIPQSFLQVGSSMLTLDVVDDTHLLLTFSSRGLVPRVPNDPPSDEDRMVAAELVELPTGKIVARTDWHMHDHGRFLWRLGHGRFLVRTQHQLFVVTPGARLDTPDPLKPMRFPAREGTPVLAVVSPDKTMVMVETLAPKKKDNVQAAGGSMIVTDSKPEVMIDFYRLSGGDAPGVPLTLKGAGVVSAPAPLLLPMDADGYLWPTELKHGLWPVSFNEFGGRVVKIVDMESSCPPRLQMVSRFEFLAFTCRGSEARVRMRSYGMDGHETWEETLTGTYGVPELAYAPDAGRFALSRMMSPAGDLNFGQVIPDGATQEVRVYQTESGNLLLKVPTSPVTRFAENFDLAEDGLVAAVVNAGVIQVFRLPPPSAQDRKDLAEAKSFSPPVSDAPVNFARLTRPTGENQPAANDSAASDVASAMTPDVASGSLASGGARPPSAPATAPVAASAPGAPSVGMDGMPPAPSGAEMTRVAGGDPDGGAAAASRPDAGPKAAVAPEGAETKDGSGTGDTEAGRRRPPTLLQPGENVETVKSPPK